MFVLLLLFTLVVGYHLTRGHSLNCHCFGQASTRPLSRSTLVRNLMLLTLAGILVGFGRAHAGLSIIGWLGPTTLMERVTLGIGGLSMALLVMGVAILLQLLQKVGAFSQRLEVLEVTLEGNSRRVQEETLPSDETSVPAPPFLLPDLSGKQVTLNALLARGKPVLLLFSDPECGPCSSLLPEVRRWQRQYASKLTLALISRNTLEANRAKADQYGIELVLLQQDREVAERYHAQGTPCSVLIRADGTVRSRLACGAEQIRAQIAQAVGLPVIPSLPAAPSHGSGYALPMAVPQKKSVMPGQPSGLPRGEMAPAFTLPDLSERAVSLADFAGKPTLLIFWNPGCGFCQKMLPDLKEWEEASPKRTLGLLIISTGTIDENRTLGLRSPVLLDRDFTVGSTFGVRGTPMAILIDAEGKIASKVAAGAAAIFDLAGSNQLLVGLEA
jgi:peroxiredoxin